jgi:hypothetical protein
LHKIIIGCCCRLNKRKVVKQQQKTWLKVLTKLLGEIDTMEFGCRIVLRPALPSFFETGFTFGRSCIAVLCDTSDGDKVVVVEDDEGAECTRDGDVGSCGATLFVVYWPEPSDNWKNTILKNMIF